MTLTTALLVLEQISDAAKKDIPGAREAHNAISSGIWDEMGEADEDEYILELAAEAARHDWRNRPK